MIRCCERNKKFIFKQSYSFLTPSIAQRMCLPSDDPVLRTTHSGVVYGRSSVIELDRSQELLRRRRSRITRSVFAGEEQIIFIHFLNRSCPRHVIVNCPNIISQAPKRRCWTRIMFSLYFAQNLGGRT